MSYKLLFLCPMHACMHYTLALDSESESPAPEAKRSRIEQGIVMIIAIDLHFVSKIIVQSRVSSVHHPYMNIATHTHKRLNHL